jgi:hypothetical protein
MAGENGNYSTLSTKPLLRFFFRDDLKKASCQVSQIHSHYLQTKTHRLGARPMLRFLVVDDYK